jgi:hypothetical protein
LTDDQRKELKKREYLTYTRINKASTPPSQLSTPPPLAEKVVPPPPPIVHEFLPKTTPTNEIQLNIDVATMFGKFNMTASVTKMYKIPSMRRELLKLLQVPTEKEYPSIIMNTVSLDWQKDNNPPFYLSLGMNGLYLNNRMLDSRASVNVMSLKMT